MSKPKRTSHSLMGTCPSSPVSPGMALQVARTQSTSSRRNVREKPAERSKERGEHLRKVTQAESKTNTKKIETIRNNKNHNKTSVMSPLSSPAAVAITPPSPGKNARLKSPEMVKRTRSKDKLPATAGTQRQRMKSDSGRNKSPPTACLTLTKSNHLVLRRCESKDTRKQLTVKSSSGRSSYIHNINAVTPEKSEIWENIQDPNAREIQAGPIEPEEHIQKLEYFHGFLQKDDLPSMLKKEGDFLLRMTIPSSGSQRVSKAAKKKSRKGQKTAGQGKTSKYGQDAEKEMILSIYHQVKDKLAAAPGQKDGSNNLRNVQIKKDVHGYTVDGSRYFRSIPEFVAFYKMSAIKTRTTTCEMKQGIGLQVWELTHDQVHVGNKLLGEGAFGEVRVGIVKIAGKSIPTAVKMLKTDGDLTKGVVKELMHEARIMRNLDHKNVLKCYGVAVQHEPLYLLSELCNLGALREYLKENAKKLTVADRINFCLCAARGVEYLHQKNYIHRDLAVRNILLTEDKIAKVADFGLSRDGAAYEMKSASKIPVRYLAPETIKKYVFTFKTDVFTFGIVIWEIFENGTAPHHGAQAHVIKEMIARNEFLKLNATAPPALGKFVSEKVFVVSPEERASMKDVVKNLEEIAAKK